MLLKAKVLKIWVQKNPGYDTLTGKPDPSYFLEATVFDLETNTTYHCSYRDTLSERLRQAYHDKLPEAARDAVAAEVEAIAKQERENQEFTLVVEGFRENTATLLVK